MTLRETQFHPPQVLRIVYAPGHRWQSEIPGYGSGGAEIDGAVHLEIGAESSVVTHTCRTVVETSRSAVGLSTDELFLSPTCGQQQQLPV